MKFSLRLAEIILLVSKSAMTGINQPNSSNFDVRKEDRERPPKKYLEDQLQEYLDENYGQAQKHLPDHLDADLSAPATRSEGMEKIQKVGDECPMN